MLIQSVLCQHGWCSIVMMNVYIRMYTIHVGGYVCRKSYVAFDGRLDAYLDLNYENQL